MWTPALDISWLPTTSCQGCQHLSGRVSFQIEMSTGSCWGLRKRAAYGGTWTTSRLAKIINKCRFMCLMYNEAKQTKTSRVWSGGDLLQGYVRRWVVSVPKALKGSLKDFSKALLKARWGKGLVVANILVSELFFGSLFVVFCCCCCF